MLLNNLTSKQIKEISKTIAPKLTTHPAFMFYCKSGKDRKGFIEDYFDYYLHKWNNKEIVLANESFDVIISLIDIDNFRETGKGVRVAKLKRYKNPFANVVYHKKNILYLTEIVAPGTVSTKIMTIYSTLKYADEFKELIDEAKKIAEENNFMIVYETFSKKSVDILSEKGFAAAYEKQFSSTQYFETMMTYYKHDTSNPVKLIETFKPIVIDTEPEETEETNRDLSLGR